MEKAMQILEGYARKIDDLYLIKDFNIPERNRVMGERIEEFFKRGGKRLRPSLVYSAIKTYDPDRLEDGFWAGVSLELDHNFFLVHDDIQDRAFTRRGGPTMHIAYDLDKAINYGDYMMVLAAKSLDKGVDVWGPGTYSRLLKARNEMLQTTAEGQDMEMELRQLPMEKTLTEENILQILRKKTGFYTIYTPFRYGAIIANRLDEEIEDLKEALINVGVSFQIADDVLDLTADEVVFGKDWAGDLEEVKRTYPLTLTLERADQKDKKRFLEILDSSGKMHGLVYKRDEFLRKEIGEEDTRNILQLLGRKIDAIRYDRLQGKIDRYKTEIIEMMKKYNVIEDSKEKSIYFLDKAMPELEEKLPDSKGKEDLLSLATFASFRKY